jgi:hypothetical protein
LEVSTALASSLQLKPGDHVTIPGRRLTVAAIEEIVKGDGFFIRPDGYTRQSAGATLNTTAEVAKLERTVDGLRVVFTAQGDGDDFDCDEVKSMLLGRLVTQGQAVGCSFNGSFRYDGKGDSHHELVFTVVETKPSQIIKITNGPQAAGLLGLSKKSTGTEDPKSPRMAKASGIQKSQENAKAIRKKNSRLRSSLSKISTHYR